MAATDVSTRCPSHGPAAHAVPVTVFSSRRSRPVGVLECVPTDYTWAPSVRGGPAGAPHPVPSGLLSSHTLGTRPTRHVCTRCPCSERPFPILEAGWTGVLLCYSCFWTRRTVFKQHHLIRTN